MCIRDRATLQQFFASMEGSLNGFTFLDPNGNLLAWSDDPSQVEWQKGSFLTLTGGVADPVGGTSAWTVANTGAGAQSLAQTLNAPSVYVYCLSVYAQAAQPTTIKMCIRDRLRDAGGDELPAEYAGAAVHRGRAVRLRDSAERGGRAGEHLGRDLSNGDSADGAKTGGQTALSTRRSGGFRVFRASCAPWGRVVSPQVFADLSKDRTEERNGFEGVLPEDSRDDGELPGR